MIERICRICGAPALPKEDNNGLICRECNLKHRRERARIKRALEAGKRLCRFCGGPALPKEKKLGRICRNCLNAREREHYRYNNEAARNKQRIPCKICGRITIASSGICWNCSKTKKHSLYHNSNASEEELLERAINYNINHPFAPNLVSRLAEAMQALRM